MSLPLRPRPTLVAAMTAAVLLATAAAQPAVAQSEPDEQALLASAERACLEGNQRQGIELLVRLYLSSRHPAYLYNQARCYEQNGEYRQAAGRYREYLRKLDELPTDAERASPRLPVDKVAGIEARALRLEQLADRAEQPGAPPASEPTVGDAGAEATLSRPAPAPGPASAGAGANWRRAGVALMVLGGLGLAGSGTSGLLATKAERDISEASRRGGQIFDPARYQAGERAARIATIGFVAAPVVALAGGLLYWKGTAVRSRSEQVRIRVLPTFATGGPGALLAVSY
jgi:hypothetical protein